LKPVICTRVVSSSSSRPPDCVARLDCSSRIVTGHVAESRLPAVPRLIEQSVGQAYDLSLGMVAGWSHDPEGAAAVRCEELARRRQRAQAAVASPSPSRCKLPEMRQRSQRGAALSHCAQEAVANALKHAKPNRVSIRLECHPDRHLTLCVRDDGIGRKAAARSTKGGLGTRIMAHRARMVGGTLAIDDGEQGGTVVRCELTCLVTDPPPE